MTLRPDLEAAVEEVFAQAVVVRPVDWNAANDEPYEWTRPRHVYRGMTEQEFKTHKHLGLIRSTGKFSIGSEGTCFSDSAPDAESYINFGRDDPRHTGKPNYLIELQLDDRFARQPDGYYKTQEGIPFHDIVRAWRFDPVDGAVVATEIAP